MHFAILLFCMRARAAAGVSPPPRSRDIGKVWRAATSSLFAAETRSVYPKSRLKRQQGFSINTIMFIDSTSETLTLVLDINAAAMLCKDPWQQSIPICPLSQRWTPVPILPEVDTLERLHSLRGTPTSLLRPRLLFSPTNSPMKAHPDGLHC